MADDDAAGAAPAPPGMAATAAEDPGPPRRLASLAEAHDLPGLANLALHRPARQSSTSRKSRLNDAQGAVNGVRNGGFGFHTAVEPAPWWDVDLGAAREIRYVVVWNREHRVVGDGRNIELLLSQDGEAWQLAHRTGESGFGGALTQTPLVVSLGGRAARFVRLRRAVPGVLDLDEVEVFGPAPPAADKGMALAALCRRLGEPQKVLRLWRSRPQAAELRFADAGMPADGMPRSLTLRGYGRFGNSVVQLVHGLHLAQMHGIGRLHAGELKLPWRAPASRFGDLEVTTGHADPAWGPDLHMNAYHRAVFPRAFARLDGATERRIGTGQVRALLHPDFTPRSPAEEPTLHVHLRGGDIFTLARPNPDYVQPPLAFYRLVVRDAVARLGIRRVVVVHEDAANPCLDPLRAWLEAEGIAHRAQSATLAEDIAELLSARHLVIGRGTFAYPVALLSDALATLYGFRGVPFSRLLKVTGATPLDVTDEAGGYTPVGRWANTPEQRQLMLDYPEEALRIPG